MLEPDELSLFAVRLESTGAPYMITGATAAVLYGQPRVTNGFDVVLYLDDSSRARLLCVFPETEFYVPPESVIRTEQARHQRGHFNLIHHETGYKADISLSGADPLHAWALPLRRRLRWSADLELTVAPPEYVVLRKLGFFREGRLAKHPLDIRSIQETTGLDETAVAPWLERLNLTALWHEIKTRQIQDVFSVSRRRTWLKPLTEASPTSPARPTASPSPASPPPRPPSRTSRSNPLWETACSRLPLPSPAPSPARGFFITQQRLAYAEEAACLWRAAFKTFSLRPPVRSA